MTDWKEITSQDDIDGLFDIYGGFHDSCIVSVSYKSGAFVDHTQAMHFGDPSERELSVVFHRQWKPQILELCFTGLRQLHLIGWQNQYFCDIFDAHLSFYMGLLPGEPEKVIVWADYSDFNVEKINNTLHEPSDTYIIANALKWRIIDSEGEL